ncbi:MAG: M48 family metallopeptidase [Planctomycetota bacterium]
MGAYQGMAFHASLPLGRSECTLSLRGHELVGAVPSGAELRLDLRQVAFERRSADGGTLCFTTRSPGGPLLTTPDSTLLEELERARIPEFDILLQAKGLTPWRRFRRRAIPVGILLLIIVGIPCFLVGCLPLIVVGMIPRSVDREIGEVVHESVVDAVASGNVVTVSDPAIAGPVRQIVDRLTAVVDREGFDFEVTVLDSEVVNAFALPGGKIVVTTALLEFAESPEEVAGVLAHEVSHVTERHTVRMIVKNVGVFVAMSALFGDRGSVRDAVMEQAGQMTALSFSRSCEEEADSEAVHVLARARVDGAGLRAFLEKMERREKSLASGQPESPFLSTHPVTADRLEDIEDERGDVDAFTPQPFDVDWAALQEALRQRK